MEYWPFAPTAAVAMADVSGNRRHDAAERCRRASGEHRPGNRPALVEGKVNPSRGRALSDGNRRPESHLTLDRWAHDPAIRFEQVILC